MNDLMAQIDLATGVRLAVWDRLGIWFSGICIVHCLTLPVFLLALSYWPELEGAHAWVHPAFALMLLVTTLPAARSAIVRHRVPGVAALLLVGLAIVLMALLLGVRAGIWVEDGLTLAGSVLLVTGHWKNGRACARGHCSH